MKKLIYFSMAALMLFACTPEKNGNSKEDNIPDGKEMATAVTVGSEQVTATGAVLKGKAIMGTAGPEDLKVGFQYSKSSGISSQNSISIDAAEVDADYNYSSSVSGLDPETKYYFRSFVRQDDRETYGETKEFTTSAIPVVNVESITLDKASLSLVIGTEATLSVTGILPDNATDKTFAWSSSDDAVAAVDNNGKVTAKAKGNATVKATANDGSGVSASCLVVVFEEKVDMGIRTAGGKTLYWSTRNICESGFVNSPENPGDYYAWGETEAKTKYNENTYKYGNRFSGPYTKYNATDGKTTLETGPNGDDVASKKLGGKWRMPTDEEWTELRTKCTWTWTDSYNGTGIKGRIVTAPDGNSIFLPAAGYFSSAELYDLGIKGNYWSSTISTDYQLHSRSLFFGSGNTDVYRYSIFRDYGLSVRPVTE